MKINPYIHVGGFSIKAQAKMDTLDLYNKNFDIVAEVPWSVLLLQFRLLDNAFLERFELCGLAIDKRN